MSIIIKKHYLLYKGYKLKCCFGKSGIKISKKEGDFSTPKGTFYLGTLYYRKDRNKFFRSKIKKKIIKKNNFSTFTLRILQCVHVKPIYVVISYGALKICLREGFLLICFQQLSFINLATRRCSGQNNRHTRGLRNSVLSY